MIASDITAFQFESQPLKACQLVFLTVDSYPVSSEALGSSPDCILIRTTGKAGTPIGALPFGGSAPYVPLSFP